MVLCFRFLEAEDLIHPQLGPVFESTDPEMKFQSPAAEQ